MDYMSALLGNRARVAPSWLYVQDAGDSTVSFVGASRVPEGEHPLRYGSTRTHQFMAGEVILRPQFVVATDTLVGSGLAFLATHDHDIERMLADGEYVDLDRLP